MNLAQFRDSLKESDPPALSPAIVALWYDAKGEWDIAPDVAQGDHSMDGSWIHAYLHRKEGDPGNAAYWYRRAGKPPHAGSLQSEWEELVLHFLAKPPSDG